MNILRGSDIEPLLKLSADIAENDGHVQFSALVGALVLLSKVQKIPLAMVHRGIDETWKHDGKTVPKAPVILYPQ